VTDPKDTQAAPDLDDRAEKSTEIPPDEAETDEAESPGSQDDSDDIVLRSVRRQRVKQAAVFGYVALFFVGGTVMSLILALRHPPRPSVQPPVKGPIDGTYRVDLYRGEGTTRTPDGKISAPAPQHSTVETEWWAFQSACPTPSCIAVGTHLDNTTHTEIAAGPAPDLTDIKKTQSLRLVNGQWVSDPPDRVPQDCASGTPGHDIWRFTVELMQLGDGTLKGQKSDLVESNECGRGGTLVTTPIVATRIGDAPSGLPPLNAK
jgi:hypothetical protein